MLETYGLGWRNNFTKRLEYLNTILPSIEYTSIERFRGMLRIKAVLPDEDSQYIADSVIYYIERESARTCETCGKFGLRRNDDRLSPNILCLCFQCYIMQVDEALSKQTQ